MVVGGKIGPTSIAWGARGTRIALIASCDESTPVAGRASVITRRHRTLPHGDELYVLVLIGASGLETVGSKEELKGRRLYTSRMGLVRCPDCGKEISDAAPTCIHCGRPQGSAARVTTVELTSKRFKSQQLCGGILVAAGMAVGMVGSGIHPVVAGLGSLIFLAVGVFVWIGGRFGAWWNHG